VNEWALQENDEDDVDDRVLSPFPSLASSSPDEPNFLPLSRELPATLVKAPTFFAAAGGASQRQAIPPPSGAIETFPSASQSEAGQG